MKLDKAQLQLMYEELENASKIYSPSFFWDSLGKYHYNQLTQQEITSFKRTVNMRYFNWGILGILRHQLSPIFSEILRGNFDPLFKSEFVLELKRKNNKNFNRVGQKIYKTFVASLAEHVLKMDSMGVLNKIQEPILGKPYMVRYKNKKISQDLCNSVHEFYSITDQINIKSKGSIAEVGAGYGRVAYIFLKVLPNISYCVIDIPPALYLAQEYLSQLFPKEKIFKFRHFDNFKEVAKEFKIARIKFLTPNQMELLPNNAFDLIINISSLHEMSTPQIKNYIKQFDRLGKGYFYTKQWKQSRVKDNNFITEQEYPIPKKWKVIFQKTHPIQKMFFEALYKLK